MGFQFQELSCADDCAPGGGGRQECQTFDCGGAGTFELAVLMAGLGEHEEEIRVAAMVQGDEALGVLDSEVRIAQADGEDLQHG